MKREKTVRSTSALIGLIGLGLVYSSLLHFGARLTGVHQVDGILGVMLGLFTSAQPAANVLDIILYGRYLPRRAHSLRARYAWWGLNGVVLLVGWWVIVNSLLRYSGLN